MIRIATILTCYNRKDKTVKCLSELFRVLEEYNTKHNGNDIALSVYLTDDGCTDGTADAVAKVCIGRDLHIMKGDGNCYWAGGMRLAWREAMKRHEEWDFYLLLNDDTIVKDNVFDELMLCHDYAIEHYGKGGIYSGITCSMENPEKITYGGFFLNIANKGWLLAEPSGSPQKVENTHANILLVSKNVVDTQGIFYEGYIHSAADSDYSMAANRNNIPVLVTSLVCGYCEYDHENNNIVCNKLKSMNLKERRNYVKHPLHSDKDYLLFIKRNMPQRYVISRILRLLRLYNPVFYYKICKYRS